MLTSYLGKTVLSSIVLDYINLRPAPVNNRAHIIYYYCSHKSGTEKNTYLELIRGLLAQLAAHNEDLVHYLLEKRTQSGVPPAFKECETLFKKAIQIAVQPDERLYMLIDGLDELPANDRKQFLQYMEELAIPNQSTASPGSSVKNRLCVYISSQNIPDIKKSKFMDSKRDGRGKLPVVSLAIENKV